MFGLENKLSAVRFSLFITELCNLKCEYCDIPLQKEHFDCNAKLLLKYLPIIDTYDFDCYTLTGGEPGLSSCIPEVFDIVTKPVKVNTNGVFFERGFFEKYYDKIQEVGYHLLKHPGEVVPDSSLLRDKKIVLYIPFDNYNWFLIPKMVEDNPDIMFNFIPYIRKIEGDSHDKTVSLDNMRKLYKSIYHFKNTQSKSLSILMNKLNQSNLESHRKFCMNSNTRYLFDFTRGKIYRCAKSRIHNKSVEMNDENIDKIKTFTLFENDDIMDEACKDCYYFTFFLRYAMRNSILKNKRNYS
jgi:organic radical activating enzyme